MHQIYPPSVCKISLSFRFRISLSDMTNYKSAFGKVCRIKNRQTFKSLPICNSSYHDLVWYAELRIGILLKVCRFVIRHITQTDTETETELLRRHLLAHCQFSSPDGADKLFACPMSSSLERQLLWKLTFNSHAYILFIEIKTGTSVYHFVNRN